MTGPARVYQRPWRGALAAATIGYLAFMPLWSATQALSRPSNWETVPAFLASLTGGALMGLVMGVIGFVFIIGAVFWVAALIFGRALVQAAETWNRHAVAVLAVGGGLIGLILGVAAAWILGGAGSAPAGATIVAGLIDGLMAAGVLHLTAGRRRPVDVSQVF